LVPSGSLPAGTEGGNGFEEKPVDPKSLSR
jgi:hypothetical protein